MGGRKVEIGHSYGYAKALRGFKSALSDVEVLGRLQGGFPPRKGLEDGFEMGFELRTVEGRFLIR